MVDHDRGGPKESLVLALGGTYHSGMESVAGLKPDIVMECTGAPSVVRDCLASTGPGGIVCLAGVTTPGHEFALDLGRINRTMVLHNDTVFGTVNANRHHYEMAVDALARADGKWLAALITRRVPLDRFTEAFEHHPGDIKVVIDLAG